jgi:hypothetical protein
LKRAIALNLEYPIIARVIVQSAFIIKGRLARMIFGSVSVKNLLALSSEQHTG